MKELFKELILNFHQSDIPKPSPRDLDFPKFSSNIRKAYTVIGMRRSGKTWSL